jgi:hypothetical protein
VGRLIEVQSAEGVPSNLTIKVGDVLLVQASGGHVEVGADMLEMLGPFVPAVIGDNGEVFSPVGAPNTVLFRALHPGRSTIDVVTGDPWHKSSIIRINVTVES